MGRRAQRSVSNGLSAVSPTYLRTGSYAEPRSEWYQSHAHPSKGETKSKVIKSHRFGEGRWQVSLALGAERRYGAQLACRYCSMRTLET